MNEKKTLFITYATPLAPEYIVMAPLAVLLWKMDFIVREAFN